MITTQQKLAWWDDLTSIQQLTILNEYHLDVNDLSDGTICSLYDYNNSSKDYYEIGQIVITSICENEYIGRYAGKDINGIILNDWQSLEYNLYSIHNSGRFERVERLAHYKEIKEYLKHVKNSKLVDKTITEKKVIGYKAPQSYYDNVIKPGDIYISYEHTFTDKHYVPKRIKKQEWYYVLPAEIVETWEKVYEKEEKIIEPVMELDRAIEILTEHNKWRKGAATQQQSSKEIGIAIDVILNELNKLNK